MTEPTARRSIRSAAGLARALPVAALALAVGSDAVSACAAIAIAWSAGWLVARDAAPAWLVAAAAGSCAQAALDVAWAGAEPRYELPLLAAALVVVHAGRPEPGWLVLRDRALALALLGSLRAMAVPGRLAGWLVDALPLPLLLHVGGLLIVAGLFALVAGDRREGEP